MVANDSMIKWELIIVLTMLISVIGVSGYMIYFLTTQDDRQSEYQSMCINVCVDEFGYTFHSYLHKELRECWCLNDGEPVRVPVKYDK